MLTKEINKEVNSIRKTPDGGFTITTHTWDGYNIEQIENITFDYENAITLLNIFRTLEKESELKKNFHIVNYDGITFKIHIISLSDDINIFIWQEGIRFYIAFLYDTEKKLYISCRIPRPYSTLAIGKNKKSLTYLSKILTNDVISEIFSKSDSFNIIVKGTRKLEYRIIGPINKYDPEILENILKQN